MKVIAGFLKVNTINEPLTRRTKKKERRAK